MRPFENQMRRPPSCLPPTVSQMMFPIEWGGDGMPRTILVTGGTGKVGAALLAALNDRPGIRVRALVRDAAKARALAAQGTETLVGSFESTSSVEQAMLGVDTLALITTPSAQALEQATRVIALAAKAGVRKVVRLSAIGASEDGFTDNARQHGRIERTIDESGMTYVFLRPQYFMQNLLGSASSVVAEGKLYAGVAQGKIAMIDSRDVAASMEAALFCETFDGQALELTGPVSLSHDDIAAELGDALGRQVVYVPVSPEAAGEVVRALGADDWIARLIADHSRAYANGSGDFVTGNVEALTGRPPRTLRQFAREVFRPLAQNLARAVSS